MLTVIYSHLSTELHPHNDYHTPTLLHKPTHNQHTHTKHTQHTPHTSDLSVSPSRAKTADSSRAVANKRTSATTMLYSRAHACVHGARPFASATIREDRNTSRSSVCFLLLASCFLLLVACCVLRAVLYVDLRQSVSCFVRCVWCVVLGALCFVLCLAGPDLYLQVRPLMQAKRLEQPTTYNQKRLLAGSPNVAKSSSPQGRRATVRTSKTSCSNPHRM